MLWLCSAVALVRLASGIAQPDLGATTFPGWKGEQDTHGEEEQYGREEWRGEIVQLAWSPRAYLLKGFLSDEECSHIIDTARPQMQKSTVADNKTGKNIPSQVRTSTGTFLEKQLDPTIGRIEKRVAQVTMVPEANQEGLQVLRYMDGQKYEPHHDYFTDQVNQSPAHGGQRFVTVLMYLTTVEKGGETVFPLAERKVEGPAWSECARRGLGVHPRRGDAVMFYSLHPNGTEDPASLHGSCPTLVGEKWSATKWIHVGVSAETVRMQKAGWAGTTENDSAVDEAAPCIDARPSCAEWAAMGECTKNADFMGRHCREACSLCSA